MSKSLNRETLAFFMKVSLLHVLLTALLINTALASRAQELLEQRITLNLENTPLRQVLSTLETAARIKFVYSREVVKTEQMITLSATDERLGAVLDKLLKPLQIGFIANGNQVALIRHSTRPGVPTAEDPSEYTSTASVDRTIAGNVKDARGDALPGVSIVVKGTQRGTTSDSQGNFRLLVPENSATLIFSFVGYQTQEIAVGNRSEVNVALAAAEQTLNEVVVTGYIAQQKRDITGSVAIVDVAEAKKIPASNIAEQLQGRVAGVQVSSSGEPGSVAFIRIRGIGSINQNAPLYVIDGVPVQNETNLNFLNPNDVESIQVLKDAASASIYGSRAANGVIVITTKRGKAGASKINVDVFTGIQAPASHPDLANPEELLQINKGLAAGAGIPFQSTTYPNGQLPDFLTRAGGFLTGDPAVDPGRYFLNSDPTADASKNYLISKANKQGTDWFREIYKPAPITSVQLSASGGSDKGQFFLGANYFDHHGIMIKNFYKRYQMRINSAYTVKKHIQVGENFSVAYQTTQAGMGSPYERSPFSNALRIPQIVPVHDINGYWGSPAGTNAIPDNPVAQLTRLAENQGYNVRLTGNVYAEVNFLRHFTAKTSFGLDFGTSQSRGYTARNFEATELNASNGMNRTLASNRNWVWYNTVAYNQDYGDHRISALLGWETRKNSYDGFSASGNGLTFGDDPNYRILTNTNSKTWNLGDYRGAVGLASLFSQVNYAFKDKYLVSGTLRRDGVSRFIEHPYGVFPAGSVGWRLSKEEFLKSLSAVNELKLRVSYGAVGNNEIGSDYPGYSNYIQDLATTGYSINGLPNATVLGFAQASVGNPDLRWETTKLLNVGLDARLFNALDLTVEWYDRKTSDILYQVPLPTTAGNIGKIPMNIGAMRNTGVDLQLGYSGKAIANQLVYGLALTAGHYKNTMVTIDANSNSFISGNDSRIGPITRTVVGQPVSQFWGYISDGVIQTEAQLPATRGNAKVGRLNFRDLNGDGVINQEDQGIIGSPIPKLTYGLNLTANYKGLDLSLYFQGVYGNQLFNMVRYFTDFATFNGNHSRKMLYEAGITYPKLDANDNYSPQRSTFYVEPGSYFRAKNLTVGYHLPSQFTNRLGIDRLRVYIQGQNLFTITKYSGLDPDVTIPNGDLSMGVDNGRYPIARSVYFGINLEF